MKNKEKKIVRLLEEGFSYETVKKMSNYHIDKIFKSIVKEAMVSVSADKFEDIKDKLGPDDKVEVTEETPLDKDAEQIYTGQEGPHDEKDMAPDGMDDDSDNNRKEMGEEFDEDAVVEELFGKPKMKTPITTLGMFEGEVDEKFESKSQQRLFYAKCEEEGPKSKWCKMAKEFSDDTKDFDSLPEKVNEGTKCWKGYEKKGMKTMFGKRVPNCVKKESTEEKIRQIEESIVSLIKKSQGKMITKGDLLSEEPSTAPTRVKPGTKERPSRTVPTPYKRPNEGPSPRPKAGDTKTAPTRVKPGTKERPSRTVPTPYKRPNEGPSPRPKAGNEGGLPEFLKFNNLNIQFRDE